MMSSLTPPLLKTAVSTHDNLVAVLQPQSLGHSQRLSIPLYSLDGNLQSTITTSLAHDDNDALAIQKLLCCPPHYICVLLNNKQIIVWNITRGVVVHTLIFDHEAYDIASVGEISAHQLLVLTRKKNKLYIHEYSLETGKIVCKIKCGMNLSDDTSQASCAVCEQYVAVRHGDAVRVLSLQDGNKVAKLKVPADDCNLMMSMEDSKLAIVTSTGITCYNVESLDAPVGQIFLSQPVSFVQVRHSNIVVSTDSLSWTVYEWPTSSNNEKEMSLKPIAKIAFKDGVEAADVSFSSSQDELVAVLYSSSKGTHVQRVSYSNNSDNKGKIIVGFPSDETEAESTKSSKRSTPSASTTTTLGPGQAGGEALQASDRSTKKAKLLQEDEDVSIAERLKQLAREMEHDDEEEEQQPSSNSKAFNTKKATTESLSHLLNQSLSSGDDGMLELCLGVRDKRIIATSLQELDSDLISLLLTKLTFRLSHKPNRAADLSVWIALVLQSGKVNELQQLRPLRNLLQERVESFPHLLQLEGRLSILAAMK